MVVGGEDVYDHATVDLPTRSNVCKFDMLSGSDHLLDRALGLEVLVSDDSPLGQW